MADTYTWDKEQEYTLIYRVRLSEQKGFQFQLENS